MSPMATAKMTVTATFMRCAVCLHCPPGDRVALKAKAAVTVMHGYAVCEEHVEWFGLPDTVEEELMIEREKK